VAGVTGGAGRGAGAATGLGRSGSGGAATGGGAGAGAGSTVGVCAQAAITAAGPIKQIMRSIVMDFRASSH